MICKFTQANFELAASQAWLSKIRAEVRDPQYPDLVARFYPSGRSSWFFLSGRTWRRLASVRVGARCRQGLSKRQVVKLLPELRERAVLGDAARPVGDFATVDELLRWFEQRGRAGLSAHRFSALRSMVRRQLRPRLGAVALSTLGAGVVEEKLLRPMLEDGLAKSYCKRALADLKTICGRAVVVKLLPVSPIAAVSFGQFRLGRVLPKGSRLLPMDLPLWLEQVCAARLQLRVFLLLLVIYGPRLSELLRADWRQFDFDSGVWRIPAAHTKSGREHGLPLVPLADALLRDYWGQVKQLPRFACYLFPNRSGSGPTGEGNYSQQIFALSEGRWSAHDVRKLVRSCWAEGGIDDRLGELLLNHADGVLQRVYVHADNLIPLRGALLWWQSELIGKGLLGLLEPGVLKTFNYLDRGAA